MKVLQAIDSLALGGAEVLVANMHIGLRERGVECEYYLLHSEETPLERKITSQGARIHVPLSASVYSPLHIWALQNHLRKFKYDVVHVHLFPAQLWAACGARLARTTTPLVTTEHSTHARRRTRWYRGIDRWMYGQYQGIASVSPATTVNLAAWLPEVLGKVVVCPNGIDVDAIASAQTSGKQALLSVSESTPVLACVGSLETAKGHETLLRAVSLVPDVVVGLVGDGSLWAQLHTLAEELGIESRVRFLGKRMDVPQILKAVDVYVQPSLWEGFGIAALEAMAAGKPVVASNVPGLAEMVGDAGILFPVGNVDQLARSIATLLGDANLRQRLGEEAQQRSRMFSLDKTIDCYERLYREVGAEVGR